MIGDDIEIEVLELSATRVKLGIVAPESVVILRLEMQITREENLTAASDARQEMIFSLLNQLNGPELADRAFSPAQENRRAVKNLTDFTLD